MKKEGQDIKYGQPEYQTALKKFVNLQYLYGIQKKGEIFSTYLYHAMEEHKLIGLECKEIIGENSVIVTKEDILSAKGEFLDCCRRMQQNETVLFLELLLEIFQVSDFEAHCIRLVYIFELDKAYGTLAALLQDDWGKSYITPYLAQLLYEEEIDIQKIYEVFWEGSILSQFFLQKREDEGAWFLQGKFLEKRMLDFAMGQTAMAECYQDLVTIKYPYEELEAWIGKKRDYLDFFEEQLKNSEKEQLFYLYGEEGSGKRFSVLWACKNCSRVCFLISLDKCYKKKIQDEDRFSEYFKGIVREIIIYQAVPVLVLDAEETGEIKEILGVMELYVKQLTEYSAIVFLCGKKKVMIEMENSVIYFPIEPLSLLEGKQYWEAQGRLYPIDSNMAIGSMANKFTLTRGKIKQVFQNAEKKRKVERAEVIKKDWITKECYEVMQQNMGQLAQKVPVDYLMSDLVLPYVQKKQLENVCNQVKYKHFIYEEWGFGEKILYGKGISMAFVGAPGTGKTMAAQVIAKELGMELYKVELASVVSKYVGETEKNLNEIFKQAKKSQVILFFDEADVLFSKRTEGKESTDKYSNMEAAFLLQKMEGYDGITILATNLFHHFDEAFKRRLKVVVEFPMPDREDRKQLWMNMLPEKVQTGEIDFDYLAEHFELSGSNIRNILVHSAFLAAANHKVLGMDAIIPAIKNEYAKNGKVLLKEDVMEYYMYLE